MLNLETYNLSEVLAYGTDADCRTVLQAIADGAQHERALMLWEVLDAVGTIDADEEG